MNDAARTASPAPADAGARSAPDDVWEQVRDDYLAGWSAPACCRRHGVGLSTLRKRAAEEGWRRTDQPWSRPGGLERDDEGLALEEQFDGDLDQIPLGELSVVAFQRMMRAVLHGNAIEALRWRRVHNVILSEAAEIERRRRGAEHMRKLQAQQQAVDARNAARAAMEAIRAAPEPLDPTDWIDGIDDIDGVFSPSPGLPRPPPFCPASPAAPR